MSPMPIIIPMPIYSAIDLADGSPEKMILLCFYLIVLYFAFYLLVMVISKKWEWSELSLFGKIVFLPIGIIGWIIRKIF